jgi:hypothetical protein
METRLEVPGKGLKESESPPREEGYQRCRKRLDEAAFLHPTRVLVSTTSKTYPPRISLVEVRTRDTGRGPASCVGLRLRLPCGRSPAGRLPHSSLVRHPIAALPGFACWPAPALCRSSDFKFLPCLRGAHRVLPLLFPHEPRGVGGRSGQAAWLPALAAGWHTLRARQPHALRATGNIVPRRGCGLFCPPFGRLCGFPPTRPQHAKSRQYPATFRDTESQNPSHPPPLCEKPGVAARRCLPRSRRTPSIQTAAAEVFC